jgi:hypothetical protein
MWVMLPQSIYPITTRDSYLTHYGGIVYGKYDLERGLGKFEYDAWLGEGKYNGNAGLFLAQTEAGYTLPNGAQGPLLGGGVHWRTPLPGLMVGHTEFTTLKWTAPVTGPGNTSGTQTFEGMTQPNSFAVYDRKKVMVAYEYCRNWARTLVSFPGANSQPFFGRTDPREWYAMGSYKVTRKLSAGVYDSQITDHQAPLGPPRYQKDWAVSGRYDLNEFLYLKAEQHFIEGTQLNYDALTNPGGLKPNTKLTAMKIGVSF